MKCQQYNCETEGAVPFELRILFESIPLSTNTVACRKESLGIQIPFQRVVLFTEEEGTDGQLYLIEVHHH